MSRERLYREVSMLLIGEGTAEIQKMIVGRRLEEYRTDKLVHSHVAHVMKPEVHGVQTHWIPGFIACENTAARSRCHHLALADHGDTAGGYHEPAGPVVLLVHPDRCALGDGDVLV